MSLSSFFGVSAAHAAGEAGQPAGGGFQMIIILVIFAAIFYFMIYRPQSKRAKEHKNLMSSLSKGDEVLTSGGLVGKIVKITDTGFVVLSLDEQTKITIKRDFVTAVLPKGSIQSM
ncbi:preprotein translocase subunit YajC [Dongshaea marina]|uniref:preprotein translocase subunit YajC n=1 Tax=Dongshaea marina TaxID=2047966 RepID=UPI000D3E1695|nr:preprotein translocase subunit YajC [Dongshaea marina]